MNIITDKDKRTVTIEQIDEDYEKKSITMTIGEFSQISKYIDKEFYYREDVINRLQDEIALDKLPKEALDDEEYINKVLNDYTEYLTLHSNGGEYDSMMHWKDCLNSALENNDYQLYIDEKEGMELE